MGLPTIVIIFLVDIGFTFCLRFSRLTVPPPGGIQGLYPYYPIGPLEWQPKTTERRVRLYSEKGELATPGHGGERAAATAAGRRRRPTGGGPRWLTRTRTGTRTGDCGHPGHSRRWTARLTGLGNLILGFLHGVGFDPGVSVASISGLRRGSPLGPGFFNPCRLRRWKTILAVNWSPAQGR